MIVLDTNVVSELTRAEPDAGVVDWVDRYPADEVFLTAVTAAELRYGVTRLPDGRRRRALAEAVEALLAEDFQGRVLPFDAGAARAYATLVVAREAEGTPISTADAQIASVCVRHDALLATRNVADFAATGARVVNPWRVGR
ncbi:type II toxin-antitoxin system VapC family toxin [Saccharomonospora saliphila]|uniref:type II toxin-antitoxin system VapC family toxin n=1 Tax=Saccharomonospora saliphila TaxID=369829 RepID=UPI0003625446|nr:type II toxin-antitoxin system VapC family toxin [Saccharomonospora saliphila]